MLFASGGTLENPAGDGLITYFVREATHDGPEVAIMGIAALVLFWGAFLFSIVTAFRVGLKLKAAGEASSLPSTATRSVETAALLLFLVLNQLLGRVAPWELSQILSGDQEAGIEKELALAAIELNADLPLTVDDITVLNRVSSNERVFTYHYTVDIGVGSVDETQRFVRGNVLYGQCVNNPDSKILIRDNDVTYIYSYSSPMDDHLFEISIDKEACYRAGLLER